MIQWVLKLLEKSKSQDIHIFSLDFSSALLANILHSHNTLDYLEKNVKVTKEIMTGLLSLLKENIPTSVLMHILICLSYLSKERFSTIIEQCQFVDKISDFVEFYSQLNITESDNSEIDKKTVLDLCAHMFHPKDSSNDVSGTMEYNELKQEERIKEFENAQGDLIFECFQDEVS
jgi:predicted type IV restriction endonuclease